MRLDPPADKTADKISDEISGAGTVAASLAAIGTILAASSCCLPLFPFMVAAGLASTSAFLAEVQPYLLVGSILFIALRFYQARRTRKSNRRTNTVALVLLCASAGFVLVSSFFPQIAKANSSPGDSEIPKKTSIHCRRDSSRAVPDGPETYRLQNHRFGLNAAATSSPRAYRS